MKPFVLFSKSLISTIPDFSINLASSAVTSNYIGIGNNLPLDNL